MKPPKKGINFTQHKDKENKIFITGWRVAQAADLSRDTWISAMSGECIGVGDIMAYYVDTQEARPGFVPPWARMKWC